MADLADFLPEVRVNAPGCADIVAAGYVLDAAIAFCNASHVVTEKLDAETVPAGTSEFELHPSGLVDVVAVVSAYRDGTPLDPVTEQDLKLRFGNWQTMTGVVSHYTAADNVMRLFKIPDSAIEIAATVAVRPRQNALSVPDALMIEWRRALVSGALADILMIPGQTFTNPEIAGVHRIRFKDAIAAAQGKAIKQTHYAPLRTRPW